MLISSAVLRVLLVFAGSQSLVSGLNLRRHISIMRHTLSDQSAQALRFGPFELDVKNCELRRNGARVPLQKQPCKVLTCLALNPGHLVSREDIKKQVWGDQTHVDFDAGLNFCIRQIRRTLGDNVRQPQLFETEPRRGYRFIGAVESMITTPIVDDKIKHLSISIVIRCSENLRECQILARLTEGIVALLVSDQLQTKLRDNRVGGVQT